MLIRGSSTYHTDLVQSHGRTGYVLGNPRVARAMQSLFRTFHAVQNVHWAERASDEGDTDFDEGVDDEDDYDEDVDDGDLDGNWPEDDDIDDDGNADFDEDADDSDDEF